ncbi:MAG TPA: C39 family peptidase [Coxiellaceae bacterium]|nr:C39 family peptidase [Coxiellaceae bacterium]
MKKFLIPVVAALGLALIVFVTRPNEDNQSNFPANNSAQNNVTQNNATENNNQAKQVLHEVPFVSQAPFGDWNDDRQQDGCEEASMLMAIRWATNQNLTRQQALEEIHAMSAFEQQTIGTYHDTSAADTVSWARNYFDYEKIELEYDINAEDIKQALRDGKVVVVPADGTKLNNPNFTPPGPERHMFVIRGFDESKGVFITNDPGTRNGEEYEYSYNTVINAILDYSTGKLEPVTSSKKLMIVVSK